MGNEIVTTEENKPTRKKYVLKKRETVKSDYKVNYPVQSPQEVAKIMHAKWELGLNGGVLLANPIKDEDSYDRAEIDQAINTALAEAKEKNIVGKEITPFLLGKIKDITGGASLEANIKLVLNNCDVAAKVAKEFYSSLHKTIK